jgi:Domain of unknown function (DUF4224)
MNGDQFASRDFFDFLPNVLHEEGGMTSDVIMTALELKLLTGYSQPCKQLEVLRARGFHRAIVGREGQVLLERPHFEAVCRSESSSLHRDINLTFMKAR